MGGTLTLAMGGLGFWLAVHPSRTVVTAGETRERATGVGGPHGQVPHIASAPGPATIGGHGPGPRAP